MKLLSCGKIMDRTTAECVRRSRQDLCPRRREEPRARPDESAPHDRRETGAPKISTRVAGPSKPSLSLGATGLELRFAMVHKIAPGDPACTGGGEWRAVNREIGSANFTAGGRSLAQLGTAIPSPTRDGRGRPVGISPTGRNTGHGGTTAVKPWGLHS